MSSDNVNYSFTENGVVYNFNDVFVSAEIFRRPSLWLWGLNDFGYLGVNDNRARTTPVTTLLGGNNWKSVSCGYSHTAAIKTDGTLWVWGLNDFGQLGVNDRTTRSTPVTTLLGGTSWKSVTSGLNFISAIKTDGTLWTWGTNFSGQLGVNDTTTRSTPVTTLLGGTNWKEASVFVNYTTAIKTDGTLWTWGTNSYGQLGVNDNRSRSTPVTTLLGGTWKSVSCGGYHIAAIKTDGTLWSWGRNNTNQLGIAQSTFNHKSTPVQVFGGGTNWRSISCQKRNTAAIKTDGTLWIWGDRSRGQLGDNISSVTSQGVPVTTILGGTNWKSVACGYQHTTATKTDGTLWTWGLNDFGQLGVNDSTTRSTPVTTLLGGTNWKSVTKDKNGDYYTAAIEYEPDP